MSRKHGFFRPHLGHGFPQVASTTLREGGGYEAEANALFARFTTPATAARKTLINNLIKALKAAGVWAKLDAFYMMAAADAQAAQRNWVADQYNLTLQLSPTFRTDGGYTPNGTNSYLKTGFNPATAVSPKFVRDSGHLSAFDNTARAAADQAIIGNFNNSNNGSHIFPRGSTGVFAARVNDLSAGPANSVSNGHFIASRTSSTDRAAYRDGVAVGSIGSTASLAVISVEMFIGAMNTNGSAQFVTTDEISQASIGAGLDASEALALYTAVLGYLTAVGFP